MLHSDSERRIADITNIANMFKEKGYSETANGILSFAEILEQEKVPPDFLGKLESLFNLFQKEFAENLPFRQNYRRLCFEEITETVLKAMKRMKPTFNQALLMTLPLLKQLGQGRKIVGEIGEELRNERINDKNVIFHLYCYSYLVIVEGVFDELARMFYFLSMVSKNKIPTYEELEKMTVRKIIKNLKPIPIFLQNWEEKNSIRNAIGHARAYYDSAKDEAHFVDIDMKKGIIRLDKTYPMSKFVEMGHELEASVVSFLYTVNLLRIRDLIVSKNAY